MTKYCRDQAREELWLMMGGGLLTGVGSSVPFVGAFLFQGGLTVVQAIIVTRIAKIYNVNIVAAGGAGALAAAIMAMGGGQFFCRIGGRIAGFVPIVGQFVQPAIGAAAVKGFGEAAIIYFEKMHPNKIYNPK
ncbi:MULTISPECIES: hypothetical protein [Nostocales]|uniref:Uncharacterized protein n=2 Tax=Tolypothrix TaxID=111782 RepID=A0A0C1QWN8_9CYAN